MNIANGINEGSVVDVCQGFQYASEYVPGIFEKKTNQFLISYMH